MLAQAPALATAAILFVPGWKFAVSTGSLIAPILAGMKRMLFIAGAGLLLAGCMSPYGWGDDGYYGGMDPYYDSGYYGGGYYGAPVGWWGSDAASIDLFYGLLGGYGSWQSYGNYGRVFIPRNMGAGWQPYSRGMWQSDPRYGQMWVSGDPFGWATDHYGRWGHDNRLGWFWVPDTKFGPGWVDWRTSDGRRSWAPALPNNWRGSAPAARRWISAPASAGQPGRAPGRQFGRQPPRSLATGRTPMPNGRSWQTTPHANAAGDFRAEAIAPASKRPPVRVTTPDAVPGANGWQTRRGRANWQGQNRGPGGAQGQDRGPGPQGQNRGPGPQGQQWQQRAQRPERMTRSTDPAANSAPPANSALRGNWRTRQTPPSAGSESVAPARSPATGGQWSTGNRGAGGARGWGGGPRGRR